MPTCHHIEAYGVDALDELVMGLIGQIGELLDENETEALVATNTAAVMWHATLEKVQCEACRLALISAMVSLVRDAEESLTHH